MEKLEQILFRSFRSATYSLFILAPVFGARRRFSGDEERTKTQREKNKNLPKRDAKKTQKIRFDERESRPVQNSPANAKRFSTRKNS